MEKKDNSFIFVLIMGKIYLKNIRLYAYHGCMAEEEKIGSDYVVNLKVKTDLKVSSITDNLEDTVDYVSLNSIIKEEMKKRANLLENVANRIVEFPSHIKHRGVSQTDTKTRILMYINYLKAKPKAEIR